MKDAKPILYSNDAVAEAVTTYSEAHSLDLPKWLTDYHADVCANNTNSNLMISTYQASALVWLARLIDAKRGIHFCSYTRISIIVFLPPQIGSSCNQPTLPPWRLVVHIFHRH